MLDLGQIQSFVIAPDVVEVAHSGLGDGGQVRGFGGLGDLAGKNPILYSTQYYAWTMHNIKVFSMVLKTVRASRAFAVCVY